MLSYLLLQLRTAQFKRVLNLVHPQLMISRPMFWVLSQNMNNNDNNNNSKTMGKKYTSGPRYWNVPVLGNSGTFLVYQYCLKMWYLRSFECARVIQKLTLLWSNIVQFSFGTWSILFQKMYYRNSRTVWARPPAEFLMLSWVPWTIHYKI